MNVQNIVQRSDRSFLKKNTPRFLQALHPAYDQKKRQQIEKALDSIVKQRFSTRSGQGFAKLKKLTNYNQKQKDVAIMNKALINGKVVDGQQFERRLTEHFQAQHSKFQHRLACQFPELNATDNQVIEMAKNVKLNKAIALDGISDWLFKIGKDKVCQASNIMCATCRKKVTLCKSFLHKQYWNQVSINRHCTGRLIPLNKMYPKTGKLQDYRAITVLSPLIKFIEGRLISKLRKWCSRNLRKEQFGLIPGCSIEQCKLSLIDHVVQKRRQTENVALLFIDFKAAYDSLNRQILFQIIERKAIFTEQQMQLLKWLLTNTLVRFGQNTVKTSNGVAQGSTLAPYLFDIYVDSLIEELVNVGVFVRMFADDLVVAADLSLLQRSIVVIQRWAGIHYMTINKAKSGIIDFSKVIKDIYHGFPVVGSYKYLGLKLSRDFQIKDHLQLVNGKYLRVANSLYPLRRKENLRINVNLFQIFILPNYRLSFSLFPYVGQDQKDKILKDIRVKFKRFCLLPINTANHVVFKMLGNPEKIILNSVLRLAKKLKISGRYCREIEVLNQNQEQPQPRPSKHFPDKLTQLLRFTYGSRCLVHNCVITTTHLQQLHNLNINFEEIIDLVQLKQTRRRANSIVSNKLKEIETIRKQPGRRRGRRWN